MPGAAGHPVGGRTDVIEYDHNSANIIDSARASFDISKPVLFAFALILCALIAMPISWLVYYAFTDQGRCFHTRQFSSTGIRRGLSRSAVDHVHPCDHVGADLLRGGGADGLAGGPYRHAAAPHGTALGDGLVRDAAVPWCHCVGAAGGSEQRPAQSALSRNDAAPGRIVHLFNIYSFTGLVFVISCYTFPYVFVLVANALDRTPGDLEDASAILGGKTWDTARRITIPLALPAVLAGALVAFLQAMTLFGSPAILAMPAGFHTMTTKIWSLFQFPPKPELAAAASLPLAGSHCDPPARGAHGSGPARLFGRRGKKQRTAYRAAGGLALGDAGIAMMVLIARFSCPISRCSMPRSRRLRRISCRFNNFTLQNLHFVFFELSATQLALRNTFILGTLAATAGTFWRW